MTPLLYLRDEYDNVYTTLQETLRHDYGTKDGQSYYVECTRRLEAVKRRIDRMVDGDPGISTELQALAAIVNRVSLIERSHLGEFSWPFADAIRVIAGELLVEKKLKGDFAAPIMHVVAEGTGYHIRNERVTIDAQHRIAIVAFPRQLKHHVLMHAIFGHELGHAAFYTNVAGRICNGKIVPSIRKGGHLESASSLDTWLRSADAPEQVRKTVESAAQFRVKEAQVKQWSLELMCDLFGLMIFGPAFVAAHRTHLEPASTSPFEIDLVGSTHPPLTVRRRLLTTAMRKLGWDQPTTTAENGAIHDAERAMLAYCMDDPDGAWSSLVTEGQVAAALDHVGAVFDRSPHLKGAPPEPEVTRALVGRLARRLPPILEVLDERGTATQRPMATRDCLYAGWTYWFGRNLLSEGSSPLTFLQTNRLCDHALLQQQAIDLVLKAAA